MSIRQLSLMVVLLLAKVAVVEACVCGTPDDIPAQWGERRKAVSAYIFLGRITRVKSPPQIPRLEETADVEILENLKGTAKFVSISAGWCQNFELKQGESRIFFVSTDGVILNCSNYRSFLRDAELLSLLRRIVPKNAN